MYKLSTVVLVVLIILAVAIIFYFTMRPSSKKHIDTPQDVSRDAANTDLIPPKPTAPATSTDIHINFLTPANNLVWKQNSTQHISWSFANLPKGNFNIVIFLVGYNETADMSGSIVEQPAKMGTSSASYVVGTINTGGDAITELPSGSYKIIFRIYELPSGTARLGYGQFITEKTFGDVTVK